MSSSSNVPEFSVSDLAFSLKRSIEEQYGHVRVRGELSRVSIAGSGHMYSSLKDDGAVIDAVCWKGVMSKLSVKPEEGLEVIVTGRVSTFPQRSNYQLIIETMELAGEGALLKMLEERKKKLAAEGLFATDRKRELPFLPEVIGVVTSPTGAVIRDILHRLQDRFPRDVLLWPVLVQGQGAAEQVAQAIEGFQSIDEQGLKRPDVLIVARGGGSLEDLMPFNEEVVVRAIANSAIPVISAVGHETDTTLSDFAADVRAPTPTGAAEMAVPVRAQLRAQILDNEQRLYGSLSRSLEIKKERLSYLASRLGEPSRMLDSYSQRVDMESSKLSSLFSNYVSRKRERYAALSGRMAAPSSRVRELNETLKQWSERMSNVRTSSVDTKKIRLDQMSGLLEAYSFQKVLERGYSVVRDESGQIVKSADMINSDDCVSIEFKGQKRLNAIITDDVQKRKVKDAPPKKKRTTGLKAKDEKQTSLF